MRALFCKMKRGRDTAEEMSDLPVKKKDIVFNAWGKKVFWLVLPFLFPGHYDDNNFEAFRTWLALAGTCRRLRYWELLRRWISYVAPTTRLCFRLCQHGFPRRLLLLDLRAYHEEVVAPLKSSRHFDDFVFIVFASYILDMNNNIFPANVHKEIGWRWKSDFDITLGQIPFFNCMSVKASHDRSHKYVLVYLAPSFAEMVLFCYAAMSDTRDEPEFEEWFLCIPLWKHKVGDEILFAKKKRETYLKKSLLGKLRRIGNTAPLDYGFTNGSLQRTAFSYFMEACDTSGSKSHTTPHNRLTQFVQTWFKQDAFARTEAEKGKFALHEDEPFFY